MSELSLETIEVLHVAVREARSSQLKSVAALRVRLNVMLPGRSDDIDKAIAYWVKCTK